MPILPVAYQPRPYVRSPRFAELLLRSGEQQAENIRRQGDISAQLWSGLGQNIAGGINQYAQERQQAPIRAQEAEAARLKLDRERNLAKQDERLMQLFSGDTPPEPNAIIGIVGPERGLRIAQGLTAFHELQSGPVKDARETAGRLARATKALSPQMQTQFWPAIRAAAIKGGLGDAQTIPEQPDPEFLTAIDTWASGEAPKAPPSEELVQVDVNGTPTFMPRSQAAGKPAYHAPQAPEPLHPVAGADGRVTYAPRSQAVGQPVPQPREPQGAQPPWQWVNRDGKSVYTNRVIAGDTPTSATVKTTEDERKTAGFYGQMSDAIQVLDELEPLLTQKELYQIQTLPQEGLVGMANRGDLREPAKRYLRAFEQFTEARLRPVSGAVIADSEYARDRRTYAKQYAETPQLASDRKAARERARSSLRLRAGVAIDDGTAAAAGAGQPTGTTVRMRAPNGQEKDVPVNEVEAYRAKGATVVR